MIEPIKKEIDQARLIDKLVIQNANLNLQVQMLTLALEDVALAQKEGGVKDGNTKQTK